MKTYIIIFIGIGCLFSTWVSEAQGKFFTGGGSGYSSSLSSAVLPVELLHFSADVEGDDVVLKWATATEINNDFFTAERSGDGVVYESIGEIQGNGDSDAVIHYEFIDHQPLGGMSYYRLKQTDYDGQFEYSEIKLVIVESTGNSLIFPNPISENDGDLTIQVNTDEPQLLYVLIYDSKGIEIYRLTEKTISGLNQFEVSLHGYRPNIYFMNIVNTIGQSFGAYKIIRK